MVNGEVPSWLQMKEVYGKRRRTDVVASDVPEFFPEPDVAHVVKEKRKGPGSIPEVVHSQAGKRKVRETVGTRRSVLFTDQEQGLLHPNKGKDNSGDRQKERRSGKLTRTLVARENEKMFSDSDHHVEVSSEILETEKPEFQLPSADLLRLGGIAAVEGKDLFPEMYGKNGGETEERNTIETRLSRFQNPNFLNIKNSEGKTVEEIIQEYINIIAKFFDEHGEEVKNLRLAWGYKNAEEYLARYMQFLVRWYPKTFARGDDYATASHDRLLSKLRDGLNKAFENSISYPREGLNETEEFKRRKETMERNIHGLVRDVYGIVDQLPYVDEQEHKKAA